MGCRGRALVDIERFLRIDGLDIRHRTRTGTRTYRPAAWLTILCIRLEGLLVGLGRIQQLTGRIDVKRYPCLLIARRTYVEVIVLLGGQLIVVESLTRYGTVRNDVVAMIVGIVLDSGDRHRLLQHLHYPLVVVRHALPGHIHGVRRRMIQFEVKRLDTRRILQFHIVNQYVATHRQVRAQTGRDSQLVVLQVVVRQDKPCLLERRSAHIDGIQRLEAVLIRDVAHRSDDHHARRAGRTRRGTYVEGEQHIR